MTDIDYQPISSPDEIKFLLKRITQKRPKSSKALLELAVRYFEQAADTQLPNNLGRPTPRPWTLDGLLLSANLTRSDWNEYKQQPLYKRVCERITMCIRTQKFELAATGAYNAAVMVRDLELIDKTDMTSDGDALPSVFVREIVDTGAE